MNRSPTAAGPSLSVRKEGEDYLLTFAGLTGEARLYAGAAPYDPAPAPIAVVSGSGCRVPSPLPGARVYFALRTGEGDWVWAADRAVEVCGVENFRDLGGYPAHGGREVRWGRFFRSGRLRRLDEAGRAALAGLGLARIIDFRAVPEAAAQPDELPEGAEYLHVPAFAAGGAAARLVEMDMMEQLLPIRTEGDADAVRRMFASVYADLPFANAAYRRMFESLDDEDRLPMLQHCYAGKDRTGVSCALLLLALGVPREIVLADYLLSGRYRAEVNAQYLARLGEATLSAPAMALAGEMISVAPALLHSALNAIDARYQSFEAFLAAEYGVDAARLSRWRGIHTV